MSTDTRIQAVIDRLEAWKDGERQAQQAAEEANDRHTAEGHWNRMRNYQGMADTLRDIQESLS